MQLKWWIEFLEHEQSPRLLAPMLRNYNAPMLRNYNAPMLRNSISILSDASLSSWGGTRLGDGKSHPDAVASGQWTAKETESQNINVLELKGALLTLKCVLRCD